MLKIIAWRKIGHNRKPACRETGGRKGVGSEEQMGFDRRNGRRREM
jgi:hypothetical protein